MTESRLERWSRKKAGAGKKVAPPPPEAVEYEPSPEEQELAINEALPEHEVLEKYGLPDPDAIELGTDIKGFLRKEIPELLRRRALRGLWRSNPVLAVLDGLNDYDEDYTDAALSAKAVQTLYKVGQGFDRKPKVEEPAAEQIEDRTEEQAETPKVSAPAEESGSLASVAGETADESGPKTAIEPLSSGGQGQPEAASTEGEAGPVPHYRPRMRFE